MIHNSKVVLVTVLFLSTLALRSHADLQRIYTAPDPAAQGGAEGSVDAPLIYALAINHDLVRVYQAALSDGGKAFKFTGLPTGKYDIVLLSQMCIRDRAVENRSAGAQQIRERLRRSRNRPARLLSAGAGRRRSRAPLRLFTQGTLSLIHI